MRVKSPSNHGLLDFHLKIYIPYNLSSFVIQHKSHFPQQGFVDSFLVQTFHL